MEGELFYFFDTILAELLSKELIDEDTSTDTPYSLLAPSEFQKETPFPPFKVHKTENGKNTTNPTSSLSSLPLVAYHSLKSRRPFRMLLRFYSSRFLYGYRNPFTYNNSDLPRSRSAPMYTQAASVDGTWESDALIDSSSAYVNLNPWRKLPRKDLFLYSLPALTLSRLRKIKTIHLFTTHPYDHVPVGARSAQTSLIPTLYSLNQEASCSSTPLATDFIDIPESDFCDYVVDTRLDKKGREISEKEIVKEYNEVALSLWRQKPSSKVSYAPITTHMSLRDSNLLIHDIVSNFTVPFSSVEGFHTAVNAVHSVFLDLFIQATFDNNIETQNDTPILDANTGLSERKEGILSAAKRSKSFHTSESEREQKRNANILKSSRVPDCFTTTPELFMFLTNLSTFHTRQQRNVNTQYALSTTISSDRVRSIFPLNFDRPSSNIIEDRVVETVLYANRPETRSEKSQNFQRKTTTPTTFPCFEPLSRLPFLSSLPVPLNSLKLSHRRGNRSRRSTFYDALKDLSNNLHFREEEESDSTSLHIGSSSMKSILATSTLNTLRDPFIACAIGVLGKLPFSSYLKIGDELGASQFALTGTASITTKSAFAINNSSNSTIGPMFTSSSASKRGLGSDHPLVYFPPLRLPLPPLRTLLKDLISSTYNDLEYINPERRVRGGIDDIAVVSRLAQRRALGLFRYAHSTLAEKIILDAHLERIEQIASGIDAAGQPSQLLPLITILAKKKELLAKVWGSQSGLENANENESYLINDMNDDDEEKIINNEGKNELTDQENGNTLSDNDKKEKKRKASLAFSVYEPHPKEVQNIPTSSVVINELPSACSSSCVIDRSLTSLTSLLGLSSADQKVDEQSQKVWQYSREDNLRYGEELICSTLPRSSFGPIVLGGETRTRTSLQLTSATLASPPFSVPLSITHLSNNIENEFDSDNDEIVVDDSINSATSQSFSSALEFQDKVTLLRKSFRTLARVTSGAVCELPDLSVSAMDQAFSSEISSLRSLQRMMGGTDPLPARPLSFSSSATTPSPTNIDPNDLVQTQLIRDMMMAQTATNTIGSFAIRRSHLVLAPSHIRYLGSYNASLTNHFRSVHVVRSQTFTDGSSHLRGHYDRRLGILLSHIDTLYGSDDDFSGDEEEFERSEEYRLCISSEPEYTLHPSILTQSNIPRLSRTQVKEECQELIDLQRAIALSKAAEEGITDPAQLSYISDKAVADATSSFSQKMAHGIPYPPLRSLERSLCDPRAIFPPLTNFLPVAKCGRPMREKIILSLMPPGEQFARELAEGRASTEDIRRREVLHGMNGLGILDVQTRNKIDEECLLGSTLEPTTIRRIENQCNDSGIDDFCIYTDCRESIFPQNSLPRDIPTEESNALSNAIRSTRISSAYSESLMPAALAQLLRPFVKNSLRSFGSPDCEKNGRQTAQHLLAVAAFRGLGFTTGIFGQRADNSCLLSSPSFGHFLSRAFGPVPRLRSSMQMMILPTFSQGYGIKGWRASLSTGYNYLEPLGARTFEAPKSISSYFGLNLPTSTRSDLRSVMAGTVDARHTRMLTRLAFHRVFARDGTAGVIGRSAASPFTQYPNFKYLQTAPNIDEDNAITTPLYEAGECGWSVNLQSTADINPTLAGLLTPGTYLSIGRPPPRWYTNDDTFHPFNPAPPAGVAMDYPSILRARRGKLSAAVEADSSTISGGFEFDWLKKSDLNAKGFHTLGNVRCGEEGANLRRRPPAPSPSTVRAEQLDNLLSLHGREFVTSQEAWKKLIAKVAKLTPTWSLSQSPKVSTKLPKSTANTNAKIRRTRKGNTRGVTTPTYNVRGELKEIINYKEESEEEVYEIENSKDNINYNGDDPGVVADSGVSVEANSTTFDPVQDVEVGYYRTFAALPLSLIYSGLVLASAVTGDERFAADNGSTLSVSQKTRLQALISAQEEALDLEQLALDKKMTYHVTRGVISQQDVDNSKSVPMMVFENEQNSVLSVTTFESDYEKILTQKVTLARLRQLDSVIGALALNKPSLLRKYTLDKFLDEAVSNSKTNEAHLTSAFTTAKICSVLRKSSSSGVTSNDIARRVAYVRNNAAQKPISTISSSQESLRAALTGRWDDKTLSCAPDELQAAIQLAPELAHRLPCKVIAVIPPLHLRAFQEIRKTIPTAQGDLFAVNGAYYPHYPSDQSMFGPNKAGVYPENYELLAYFPAYVVQPVGYSVEHAFTIYGTYYEDVRVEHGLTKIVAEMALKRTLRLTSSPACESYQPILAPSHPTRDLSSYRENEYVVYNTQDSEVSRDTVTSNTMKQASSEALMRTESSPLQVTRGIAASMPSHSRHGTQIWAAYGASSHLDPVLLAFRRLACDYVTQLGAISSYYTQFHIQLEEIKTKTAREIRLRYINSVADQLDIINRVSQLLMEGMDYKTAQTQAIKEVEENRPRASAPPSSGISTATPGTLDDIVVDATLPAEIAAFVREILTPIKNDKMLLEAASKVFTSTSWLGKPKSPRKLTQPGKDKAKQWLEGFILQHKKARDAISAEKAKVIQKKQELKAPRKTDTAVVIDDEDVGVGNGVSAGIASILPSTSSFENPTFETLGCHLDTTLFKKSRLGDVDEKEESVRSVSLAESEKVQAEAMALAAARTRHSLLVYAYSNLGTHGATAVASMIDSITSMPDPLSRTDLNISNSTEGRGVFHAKDLLSPTPQLRLSVLDRIALVVPTAKFDSSEVALTAISSSPSSRSPFLDQDILEENPDDAFVANAAVQWKSYFTSIFKESKAHADNVFLQASTATLAGSSAFASSISLGLQSNLTHPAFTTAPSTPAWSVPRTILSSARPLVLSSIVEANRWCAAHLAQRSYAPTPYAQPHTGVISVLPPEITRVAIRIVIPPHVDPDTVLCSVSAMEAAQSAGLAQWVGISITDAETSPCEITFSSTFAPAGRGSSPFMRSELPAHQIFQHLLYTLSPDSATISSFSPDTFPQAWKSSKNAKKYFTDAIPQQTLTLETKNMVAARIEAVASLDSGLFDNLLAVSSPRPVQHRGKRHPAYATATDVGPLSTNPSSDEVETNLSNIDFISDKSSFDSYSRNHTKDLPIEKTWDLDSHLEENFERISPRAFVYPIETQYDDPPHDFFELPINSAIWSDPSIGDMRDILADNYNLEIGPFGGIDFGPHNPYSDRFPRNWINSVHTHPQALRSRQFSSFLRHNDIYSVHNFIPPHILPCLSAFEAPLPTTDVGGTVPEITANLLRPAHFLVVMTIHRVSESETLRQHQEKEVRTLSGPALVERLYTERIRREALCKLLCGPGKGLLKHTLRAKSIRGYFSRLENDRKNNEDDNASTEGLCDFITPYDYSTGAPLLGNVNGYGIMPMTLRSSLTALALPALSPSTTEVIPSHTTSFCGLVDPTITPSTSHGISTFMATSATPLTLPVYFSSSIGKESKGNNTEFDTIKDKLSRPLPHSSHIATALRLAYAHVTCGKVVVNPHHLVSLPVLAGIALVDDEISRVRDFIQAQMIAQLYQVSQVSPELRKLMSLVSPPHVPVIATPGVAEEIVASSRPHFDSFSDYEDYFKNPNYVLASADEDAPIVNSSSLLEALSFLSKTRRRTPASFQDIDTPRRYNFRQAPFHFRGEIYPQPTNLKKIDYLPALLPPSHSHRAQMLLQPAMDAYKKYFRDMDLDTATGSMMRTVTCHRGNDKRLVDWNTSNHPDYKSNWNNRRNNYEHDIDSEPQFHSKVVSGKDLSSKQKVLVVDRALKTTKTSLITIPTDISVSAPTVFSTLPSASFIASGSRPLGSIRAALVGSLSTSPIPLQLDVARELLCQREREFTRSNTCLIGGERQSYRQYLSLAVRKLFDPREDVLSNKMTDCLNVILYDYQRQTISWMLRQEQRETNIDMAYRTKHLTPFGSSAYLPLLCTKTYRPSARLPSSGRGGFLSEDMGLGKTLECVALIIANPRLSRSPLAYEDPLLTEYRERQERLQKLDEAMAQLQITLTFFQLAGQYHHTLAAEIEKKKIEKVFTDFRYTEADDFFAHTVVCSLFCQMMNIEYRSLGAIQPLFSSVPTKERIFVADGLNNSSKTIRKHVTKTHSLLSASLIPTPSSLLILDDATWSSLHNEIPSVVRSNYLQPNSRSEEKPCLAGVLTPEHHSIGKLRSLVKTIQTAISGLRKGTVWTRATLIVVQTSTLGQWKREIKKYLKSSHELKVLDFYGAQRATRAEEVVDYDIVITTYATVASASSAFLVELDWHRLILDEAHVFGSGNSAREKILDDLAAHSRWMVTGTPYNTAVSEIRKFLGVLKVKVNLVDILEVSGSLLTFQRLFIRHCKGQTFANRRDLVTLPERQVHRHSVTFNVDERAFFDKIYGVAQALFDKMREEHRVSYYSLTIITLLTQLRRICSGGTFNFQTITSSAAFSTVVRERPAYYDSTSATQYSMDVVIKTRAGTSAFNEDDPCSICLDTLNQPMQTPCDHVYCKECIIAHANTSYRPKCPICRQHFTVPSLRIPFDAAIDIFSSKDASKEPVIKEGKLDYISNNEHSFPTILDFTSKLDAVIAQMHVELAKDPTAKFVVFTQFNNVHDLLMKRLKQNNVQFRYINAIMSSPRRDKMVREFQTLPSVTAMLVTRSSAEGLTLTAANHVFMLESFINRASEEQAVNRIHRLGQTRPIHIHYFLVHNTLEHNLMYLNQLRSLENGSGRDGYVSTHRRTLYTSLSNRFAEEDYTILFENPENYILDPRMGIIKVNNARPPLAI